MGLFGPPKKKDQDKKVEKILKAERKALDKIRTKIQEKKKGGR